MVEYKAGSPTRGQLRMNCQIVKQILVQNYNIDLLSKVSSTCKMGSYFFLDRGPGSPISPNSLSRAESCRALCLSI